MWFPLSLRPNAADFKAQLSDSLPPAVKYISFGLSALSISAITALASSTAFFVFCAKLYILEGLAYSSVK